MTNPHRNLGLGIMIAIAVTTAIYIGVSLVVVGTTLPAEVERYKEYVLAVAAQPFLGRAGFTLVAVAALFSTSSAINATLFGASRLARIMAAENALPRAFSMKEKTRDVPWVGLLVISGATLVLVNLGNLTVISSFASGTFLLIFFAINLAAFRLRARIGLGAALPLAGCVMSLGSWLALGWYLERTAPDTLVWIGVTYAGVIGAELLFSKRRLLLRAR
jgi:amino acid transporter